MNEVPAPLDAYASAKPDEPTFTLQGGDPLAASLVLLWAHLARVRTGLASSDSDWIYQIFLAARTNNVEHDPTASDNLLIRATQAEAVSWSMFDYRRGMGDEQEAIKSADERKKLDIYDLRRKCASTISNFSSELFDYREALADQAWLNATQAMKIKRIVADLDELRSEIEVRRVA